MAEHVKRRVTVPVLQVMVRKESLSPAYQNSFMKYFHETHLQLGMCTRCVTSRCTLTNKHIDCTPKQTYKWEPHATLAMACVSGGIPGQEWSPTIHQCCMHVSGSAR